MTMIDKATPAPIVTTEQQPGQLPLQSETALGHHGAAPGTLQRYAQLIQNSPQIAQLNAYKQLTAQRQATAANGAHTHTPAHTPAPTPAHPVKGGLPTQLQSGIESLSGIAMSDVRVHYNSSKPAQLQAHAYAHRVLSQREGTDIHLAPGQEKHLAHEAWHVVQQKQDRVKPTLQLKGVAINDDPALEREADVMGARAQSAGVAQRFAYPALRSSAIATHGLFAAQRQVVMQRVASTPTVTTGAEVQIVGDFASLSLSFAMATLEKALVDVPSVWSVVSNVLSFAITTFATLPDWVSNIKRAYDLLNAVASIPRSVVAIFLWGIGKLFLAIADRFYNGGWLASAFGAVTETGIYAYLHEIDASHADLAGLMGYINGTVGRIMAYFSSGNMQAEDKKRATAPADDGGGSKSGKFISLNVATPALTAWKDKATQEDRAGLKAAASAHLTLLGQKMGGDLDVELPFGPSWTLAVTNFFESSAINLPGFSIGNIKGDSIVINNKGLVSASMSMNKLVVAGDLITAEKLDVTYNAQEGSIMFHGKGSAKLWGDKRLDGEVFIVLRNDGTFEEATLEVQAPGTFAAIPDALDIIDPQGGIHIYHDKAPDFHIGTGIKVKGLPGGVTAAAAGGVTYKAGKLEGFLTNLDIVLPLGKKAKLTVGIIAAKFSAEEVTAEQAYMDFEYDKSIVDPEDTNPATEAGKVLKGDVSWLDVGSVIDLEKLSIRQGLANISLKEGKFTYEKDGGNGLRALKARALGVGVEYDATENKGSISGKVGKDVTATLVKIDFPLLAGVAGAYVQLEGMLGFSAGLQGTVAQNIAKSTPKVTAMDISGTAEASAYAKLKLSAGAFVGVPYLANLKGGIYGMVQGKLDGSIKLAGGLQYDKDKARISGDASALPKGDFSLTGALTAKVGAELKAQILVFEKQIAHLQLGDWEIGSYSLVGTITSDASGMPQFVITKQGFNGKPTPPPAVAQPIALEKWLEKVAADGGSIAYETDAARQVSKVARDITYGNYSTKEKGDLKALYIFLLKNDADRVMFSEEFVRLYGLRGASHPDSFIWSAAEWDKAVNRRTILGFEQSDSKAAVSKLIGEYHALLAIKKEERIAKLSEIAIVLDNYINNRSKVPENKVQAEQLIAQIDLELQLIG
jgi:Domain of unknown function (DUF4157)